MAPVPPRWAAVVINYNAGDLLAACIASILDDDSAGEATVVVVDNASTDDSLDVVRVKFPAVRIVENGANLGYAAAANRGIAATETPIVAVLNPDLTLERGTAAAMVHALDDDPTVSVVAPVVLNLDGSRYPSARRQPTLGTAIGHATLAWIAPRNRWTRRYRSEDLDPNVARDVDWASGAALWVRRAALDAIGGWDERYFMYVEDVDLCWRMRAADYRVRYEPTGRVTHVQGATTAQRPYRMIIEHHRSWFRFTKRRWQGGRRILLPVVAGFLTLRAGLDCAAHAIRPVLRGRPQSEPTAG